MGFSAKGKVASKAPVGCIRYFYYLSVEYPRKIRIKRKDYGQMKIFVEKKISRGIRMGMP